MGYNYRPSAGEKMCKADNGKYYFPLVHYNNSGNMHSAWLYEYDPEGNNLILRHMFNQANIGASSLIKGPDGKLYGTTMYGGLGHGVVYQFDPATLIYSIKYSFTGAMQFPTSPLLLASDGYAYGTTMGGNLYQYNFTTGAVVSKYNIPDFNNTHFSGGKLVEAGGALYGIIEKKIFKATLSPFSFQVVYGGGSDIPVACKSLETDGINLFGTTSGTGPAGLGGVFEYDIAGDYLTEHYYFNGTDGKNLYSGMSYLSDGKFYGITKEGGLNSRGVIFRFDPVSNTYTKTHDQTATQSLGSTSYLVEDVFNGPGAAFVENDTVCNAATAIFKYTTGGRFVTYQWQENRGTGWNDLDAALGYVGVNSDSLRVQNTNNSMNGYTYRCIVDGIYAGADTSNVASLYLYPTHVNILNTDLSPPYQNGDTVILAADSLSYLTYQWYRFGAPVTGATASTYMATQSGIYHLRVDNSIGCFYNTPAIHLNIILTNPVNATACSGDDVKFKITRDGPGYYSSPSWQVNDGISGWIYIGGPGSTYDSLLLTSVDTSMNGYQYRCIVNSVYSDKDTSDAVMLNVLPGCYTWPGDTDNDRLVSNNDLLPIGLHYGQTGFPRAVQSIGWFGWPSADWGTLQSNGSDLKHADCNGDGIVDNNDTLAITQNFSSYHAFVPNPGEPSRSSDPEIYFSSSNTSYLPGDWIDVDVKLGTAANPTDNLYGIAFNIDYDPSLVQSGTESLIFPSSWLGDPLSNAIKFARIDQVYHTVFGAETRIDHINSNGYGKIATFRFQASPFISSVSALNLSFSGYSANDSAGNAILFNDSSLTIIIDPAATSLTELNSSSTINVYPNPYMDLTNISYVLNEKSGVNVDVYNAMGQHIQTLVAEVQPQGSYRYGFSGKQLGMDAGIYFVKICIDGKTTMKRIVEMK
jgi:uncharacterized repeat protein (TIGR03803 family)